MDRIFEISEGFHIDLGRIICTRQYIDMEDYKKRKKQKCWIEIWMDCDQIVTIDTDINSLQDTYNVITNAWQTYRNANN